VYPNLPGTPAAIHFPPLFPLLLAPLFGIWSPAVAGAIGRALGIVCFALACRLIVRHAVSLRLLGDDVAPWVTEVLVASVAFAIPILSILGVLLSEPAFTLTLALTLGLGDHPAADWSGGRAWGVGLLAAAALLLRSVGVAALAGLLVVAWRIRLPRRHVLALVVPGVLGLVMMPGWLQTLGDRIAVASVRASQAR